MHIRRASNGSTPRLNCEVRRLVPIEMKHLSILVAVLIADTATSAETREVIPEQFRGI